MIFGADNKVAAINAVEVTSDTADIVVNITYVADQKITYSCSDEYGSGINAHENYDVMYAIAKGQTKDKNNTVKTIIGIDFLNCLITVI